MVETLEELKELNKRKVVVNFDGMLHRYDEQRQTEVEIQENEDEQLIKYSLSISLYETYKST